MSNPTAAETKKLILKFKDLYRLPEHSDIPEVAKEAIREHQRLLSAIQAHGMQTVAGEFVPSRPLGRPASSWFLGPNLSWPTSEETVFDVALLENRVALLEEEVESIHSMLVAVPCPINFLTLGGQAAIRPVLATMRASIDFNGERQWCCSLDEVRLSALGHSEDEATEGLKEMLELYYQELTEASSEDRLGREARRHYKYLRSLINE